MGPKEETAPAHGPPPQKKADEAWDAGIARLARAWHVRPKCPILTHAGRGCQAVTRQAAGLLRWQRVRLPCRRSRSCMLHACPLSASRRPPSHPPLHCTKAVFFAHRAPRQKGGGGAGVFCCASRQAGCLAPGSPVHQQQQGKARPACLVARHGTTSLPASSLPVHARPGLAWPGRRRWVTLHCTHSEEAGGTVQAHRQGVPC